MKAGALYAVITLALIGLSGWLLSLGFKTGPERKAIAISSAVAFLIQIIAFAIARSVSREQIFIGWGIGALLRFGTLAVYGLVVVRAFALPMGAALISMATFFFVAIIVEPLLLAK